MNAGPDPIGFDDPHFLNYNKRQWRLYENSRRLEAINNQVAEDEHMADGAQNHEYASIQSEGMEAVINPS